MTARGKRFSELRCYNSRTAVGWITCYSDIHFPILDFRFWIISIPLLDFYHTISAPSQAELKVSGSKFLGFAFPAASRDEVATHLSALEKKYFDATHHCYATRLGAGGEDFRAADQGEPSGTAGKPILAAIDEKKLTDILIVVVRYFGGTKLGTGGLARAYNDAATEVVRTATIVEIILTEELRLMISYDDLNTFHHLAAKYNIPSPQATYADEIIFTIHVRRSLAKAFRADVVERTNDRAMLL